MAVKQASGAGKLLKEIHAELDKHRATLAELRQQRLEILRQLKQGATQDVRKPGRLRRQIAAELTRISQLELRRSWAEEGLQPVAGTGVGRHSILAPIEEKGKDS